MSESMLGTNKVFQKQRSPPFPDLPVTRSTKKYQRSAEGQKSHQSFCTSIGNNFWEFSCVFVGRVLPVLVLLVLRPIASAPVVVKNESPSYPPPRKIVYKTPPLINSPLLCCLRVGVCAKKTLAFRGARVAFYRLL